MLGHGVARALRRSPPRNASARVLQPWLSFALSVVAAHDALELGEFADQLPGHQVGEFPELQGVMGRYYAQGERQPAG